MNEEADWEWRTSYGNEFHCVGPVNEKDLRQHDLVFHRRDTESARICGRAELSKWSVCSQKLRKIVRGGVSEKSYSKERKVCIRF